MKEHKPITIGILAKLADVGVETIRFYERKGIVQQPQKVQGFRHYTQDDVRIVRLVKKLQGVGFSLDEVKEFLVFGSCCGESKQLIKQKSLAKIQEISEQIVALQSTVKALEKFANACGANNTDSIGCHMLDCFENEWECCSNPN